MVSGNHAPVDRIYTLAGCHHRHAYLWIIDVAVCAIQLCKREKINTISLPSMLLMTSAIHQNVPVAKNWFEINKIFSLRSELINWCAVAHRTPLHGFRYVIKYDVILIQQYEAYTRWSAAPPNAWTSKAIWAKVSDYIPNCHSMRAIHPEFSSFFCASIFKFQIIRNCVLFLQWQYKFFKSSWCESMRAVNPASVNEWKMM